MTPHDASSKCGSYSSSRFPALSSYVISSVHSTLFLVVVQHSSIPWAHLGQAYLSRLILDLFLDCARWPSLGDTLWIHEKE